MTTTVLGIYAIFCIATAFTALYEIFIPVMTELELNSPEDLMVENEATSYIVLLLLGTLMAPVLIFPCIIPSFGERFRIQMLKALKA